MPSITLTLQMPDARRKRFVRALATMPDEAFDWLVLAAKPRAMMLGAHAQIWPDGLGGFQSASRAAVDEARAAAAAYLDGTGDKVEP